MAELQPTPQLVATAGDFKSVVEGYLLDLLVSEEFKKKVVDLLKKAIPGRFFDFLAERVYDTAVEGIALAIKEGEG